MQKITELNLSLTAYVYRYNSFFSNTLYNIFYSSLRVHLLKENTVNISNSALKYLMFQITVKIMLNQYFLLELYP